MENNTVQNVVHGFKVFRPDWTCSPNGNTKQYTCPGKFEEEGYILDGEKISMEEGDNYIENIREEYQSLRGEM